MKKIIILLTTLLILQADAQTKTIFIESNTKRELRTEPHITKRINKWGFTIAASKETADYIMEQQLKPKGLYIKGIVIVIDKNGAEVLRTKQIKARGLMRYGFSRYRGFAIKLDKYIKKTKWHL